MSHLDAFIILLLMISGTTALIELKLTENSRYAAQSLSQRIRVKRAWDYAPISVDETLEGGSFTITEILTISSDASAVAAYELVDDGNGPVATGIFSITSTPDGGVISQEVPLDREARPWYKIYARAVDSNGKSVEPDVEITINVRDENDNSPIFDQSSLIGNVPENSPSGTFIMRLSADDADSSYKDYGTVRYYYAGNESPPASSPRVAVSNSGEVTVVGPLDKETDPTFTFDVIAKDGEDIPNAFRHETSATVTITVTDINDHPPAFVQSSYAKSVGELWATQSTVTSVATTDEDTGVNAAASFKITGGDPDGHFSIRSYPSGEAGVESRGDIVLEKPLDFESGKTVYNLNVVAFNNGSSNRNDVQYQSSTTVTVTVTDENEPPIFIDQPYTGSVGENIDVVVNGVAQVTTVDNDFGGSQIVSYSIENPEDWFQIDSDGVISAVNPVDREDPSVNQETSQYTLRVRATDNYETPLYSIAPVIITIGDVNDNAPQAGTGWEAIICENPSEEMKSNITVLNVVDYDSSDNGSPFAMQIISDPDNPSVFQLEALTPSTGALVQTYQNQFDASVDPYEVPIQLIDTPAAGQTAQTSTQTLTISVCSCNQDFIPNCNAPVPVAAGFPFAILIAIIAAILILLIIVLAVVAYRRRNSMEAEKVRLFDEDDVRENLQAYHDEGGGEEDNDGYDISALQAPPLIAPKRQDEPPLGGAQPQPRSRVPPDTDIGDYINDAKQQADNDPTAPPFDSLLVFDYEGQGSDAGSLSSLNSGTTDASQDYDYLNNWGPRFKKLADMYGGGESD